jgi:DNA-binding response OmpR family regulator
VKTIWYVDDDGEMIQAVKLLLQLLHYKTRSFSDARIAAKALLAGERPDILMLDINMPGVSGIDLLEFVRRRAEWTDLPIIMLSSEAADIQVDTALDLGADAYVFKPVTLEELDEALETARAKRKNNSKTL